MANEAIVPQEKDFAEWYTSVILSAKLISYADVKGCINYLPNGWKIWTNIQKIIDNYFAKDGVENVQLPPFIRMSDFSKEKDHIEGFAPEAFIVNQRGNEKLTDPYILRPTSEVLFSQLFKQEIKNYRQLPLKYNQWCSVFRAEKTTKPFLRGAEFHWQELHCMFDNDKDAKDYAKKIINTYRDFYVNDCNVEVLMGEKTIGERFAGAETTYTVEVFSKDKQCIQAGTSHYLGTNFSQMYGITFQNKDNKIAMPFYTSHGLSTRIIGSIIVSHGDNKGLVMPFALAPTQVAILTILADKDPNVMKVAKKLATTLKSYRVNIDDSNQSFGYKISQQEVNGTPISIAIGPNDVKAKTVLLIRRDNGIKQTIKIADLKKDVVKQIKEYGSNLYAQSKKNLESSIVKVSSKEEFAKAIKDNKIALAPWGGDASDEDKIKKEYSVSPRVVAKKINVAPGQKCFFTNKEAKAYVYFARAY